MQKDYWEDLYPSPGPVLGKKVIITSDLTEDYTSDLAAKRADGQTSIRTLFMITCNESGDLHYLDALGGEHTETFTAGEVVTGGISSSEFFVPMLCQKVFRDSTVYSFTVCWGP